MERLIKYARICDECGKGMNDGFVIDGGESAEKWKKIRHHKDVKKISMLGIKKDGKTKHEVIFNDKSSIYIFV